MAAKPTVAIIGAGNLGTALALALRRSGYEIEAILSKPLPQSRKKARELAKRVNARVISAASDDLTAKVVWFSVPDAQIASAARDWSAKLNWKGKIAFHSSGALSSDVLEILRRRRTAVASVHPFMTFVSGSQPSLAGVPFAIEGDAVAIRMARRIVNDLAGLAFPLRKRDKPAYHAWGTFASPFFVALLMAAEQVAEIAGVQPQTARRRMMPILLQTLANYASRGPAGAFSGPIIRGDSDTIRRHLEILRRQPAVLELYLAMARFAIQFLPVRNRPQLTRVLCSGKPH
ncbi:MAG TPA: DUF2520 domain-containing protein [Verrucomicrobiae bacterium]|nr:DUF2520 domain-containing protein [Verrucomicrobiae bacterium]